MTRSRVLVALALMVTSGLERPMSQSSTAQGRSTSTTVFAGRASRAFEELVSLVGSGMLFPGDLPVDVTAKVVEGTVQRLQLSEEQRYQPPLSSWGGMWLGKTSSGTVALKIVFANALSKRQDTAEVVFWPSNAEPMPSPILTELLSKGKTTVSAESIKLSLPPENPTKGRDCVGWSELEITLTGVLVSNQYQLFCEPVKR